MKKLLMFLILYSNISNAQSKCDSITNSQTQYNEVVVIVPNKSAKEIYTNAKRWINKNFSSPKNVIKADEDLYYIRIGAVDKFSFKMMGSNMVYIINYDLEISVKDNKYKIAFNNVCENELMHQCFPESFYKKNGKVKGIKSVNDKMQAGILKTLNDIHFELFKAIEKPKDDW